MNLIKKLGPLLIFPAEERAAALRRGSGGAAGMGRPSLKTPETVATICRAIRERGHSDTHAASLAGVSSSAVSRWRQEDEDFAVQLDAARTEYLDARMKVIEETRKRDGSLDWRAQAWLMQMAAPEVYGTPSRRYSLAREKEEKKRAEEKAQAEDPNVITPEDLAQCQKWRRYSIEIMNGTGEEEARWIAHFAHHPTPPVFPGSLRIAGAEIPPEREFTPEERAQLMALAERRRVAQQAAEDREAEERRELARERGEVVEEAETEDVDGSAGHGSGTTPLNSTGMGMGAAREGTNHVEGDVSHDEGRRVEFPNRANVPESRDAANATNLPESRGAANATNLPESRGAASAPNLPESREADGSGETWGGTAHRLRSGPAAPAPWTGTNLVRGRDVASGDDSHLRALWERQANRAAATAPAGENNGASLPESRNGECGRTATEGQPATREMGLPKARRPLAGAARAAAEAKEWRRIHQLVEEEFQRSTDRAMAVAEAASREAIPGMWAGF